MRRRAQERSVAKKALAEAAQWQKIAHRLSEHLSAMVVQEAAWRAEAEMWAAAYQFERAAQEQDQRS